MLVWEDEMSSHECTPVTRHRAARVVAALARDSDDLVELLDMLGLTAAEGRSPPGLEVPRLPAPHHRSPDERDLATALLAEVTRARLRMLTGR